jgi:Eukaryotic aspartyl protease
MFYCLFSLLFIAAAWGFPATSSTGTRIPVARAAHEQNSALVRRITGETAANLTSTQAAYFGAVTIGGTAFPLILDTGSSDLWLYSTLTDDVPSGEPVYNPTTGIATGDTFSIEYVDNSTTTGDVYLDTVDFADIQFTNQAVGAATHVGGDFLDSGAAGILGLGIGPFPVSPSGSVPTILEVLATSGVLDENVFTVALMRPNEPQSFFTFGYIDTQLLGSATPIYTDVDTSQGHWQFPSESIVVNGQQIPRPGNAAVADTGTTIIRLDPEILPTIYAPLNGILDTTTNLWVFPADIPLTEYPTITIFAGDAGITLAAEDLIVEDSLSNGYYVGSIQPRTTATDILGDYWLRNTYAVHRFGTTATDFQFGVVQREPSS